MRVLLRVSLILWVLAILDSQYARAATIYVEGGCSLAEAITSANTDAPADVWCEAGSGADTIVLTYDVELLVQDNISDGGNGLPKIVTEITIEGGGYTIERGPAATDEFRLFYVQTPGILRLKDLVLDGGENGLWGGCIYARDYSLVVLTRTLVYGCSSNSGGGVNLSSSFLTVVESSFYGNWAYGEDCRGGAISAYDSDIWIDDSTFEANWAFCDEGLGGAIALRGRSIESTNNTFSANFAGSRGGAFWIDESWQPGEVTVDLLHNTFGGNQLGVGGAGSAIARDAGVVTLTGSIVHDGSGTDCDGIIVNGGDNFGCGNPAVTLLDVLDDNGGTTKTRALLAGSNAIDAAGDCGLDADQRGAEREDGSCDSGAYEHSACVELHLYDDIVAGTETFTAPCRILAEPDWKIAFPGNVTMTAGREVVFGEGFEIERDCELVVEIDPGLIVP
jgi:hypothetical protein